MFARWPLVLLPFVASIAALKFDQLDHGSVVPDRVHWNKPPLVPFTANDLKQPAAAALKRTAIPNPSGTKYPASNAAKGICKNVQKATRGDEKKAEAVKEAFLHGYQAYKTYAFGFDELAPLALNGTNTRYGWGLTMVDSLDTAIIMDLQDEVKEMLQFISQVDFTTPGTDEAVQLFEVNIRYIGGLISAYDLLKSGQFSAKYDQQQVDGLLEQATKLADKCAFAYQTPSGIPAVFVNFTTNEPVNDVYTDSRNVTFNSTNAASIGTILLEWARLSDLTGNGTYRALVERANEYLVNPSPPPMYPSLIGTQFDVDTGNMLTLNGGWQAGVDSFLEYLIKYYQYSVTDTSTEYKDFWLEAVKSTIDNIALHPLGHPELTFVSRLSPEGATEWLADTFSCFAGGNWLLGGALLDRPEITDLGVAWADGCHWLYNSTTTGLGPLAFVWISEQGEAYDPTDLNDAAYLRSQQARGYYLPEGLEDWFSRPEPIESLFYGYRITGDERWSQYAWEVFQAINTTARTPKAFAAVNNVDMPYGGSMSDSLDSFFFAETLKYIYLTFADPSVIDLSQWVFNTEAHPFQAKCKGIYT